MTNSKKNEKAFEAISTKSEAKINLSKKEKLLKFISKKVGKNVAFVKYFFAGKKLRFGNKIIAIYNTIFYCQILGCRKIFLDKKQVWFIKRKIINKKFKMIIVPEEEQNLKFPNVIIDNTNNFFYDIENIKTIKRIDLLKNEILKNLPKYIINRNDLYIYIRSGDIFILAHPYYSQAPLCFYQKILDKYSFRNIYIIAENKNNPIIDKLLNLYPNIIYNKNPLFMDISYLVQAYNIVGGKIKTFLNAIIPLNNNLVNIWIFSFSKINYNKYLNTRANIYLMITSKEYYRNMSIWKNTKYQKDLMITEKCINDFV